MTGWIVYDGRQYEKNRWFAQELLKNCEAFCDARLIITENLQFGICDDQPCMTYDGEAIARRLQHPLFGYFNYSDEYYQSIIDWRQAGGWHQELTAEEIYMYLP